MSERRSKSKAAEPVHVEPTPKGWFRMSAVWLVPLAAILIALGVAWQNWAQKGPIIEVAFKQATGVHPQETELRYRDIPVGVVETVRFSDDLGEVIVGIRVDKEVADFVDQEAQFWIVSPQVSPQGVSGLDTVLSGVYINGMWDSDAGGTTTRFVGADTAPLLELGQTGLTFEIYSSTSLPPEGTPILYRGVEVGRLGPADVSGDGLSVRATAVVRDPYASLVSSSTRFWDVSGFDLSLDSTGANIDFSSLAALIVGGVTFETMGSGGVPMSDGDGFRLYPDEDTARDEFFIEGDGAGVDVAMIFEQNLSGLQPGAPVSLGGLRLGTVVSVSGLVDEFRFGDNKARLLATARLNPGRLGIEDGRDAPTFLTFLQLRVAQGLRGRLTNASILTGGLMIELVDVPEADEEGFDLGAEPFPLIPTATANVTNLSATAQGLLARVDALPVEQLLEIAIATLSDTRSVLGSEELKAAPASILATLEALREVAEAEEIAALPAQIAEVAGEIQSVASGLNVLLASMREERIVANIATLVASMNTAAGRLPGIADQASAVLADAQALSLDELAAEARNLVSSIDALIDQDSTRDLPQELNGALEELRQTLSELRDGGVVSNTNATLTAARTAAESVSEAAQSLPELSKQLTSAATRANETLADYGRGSELGREFSDALRQIEAAAAAVDRLARQLQRNPNSLLTGR